MGKKRPLEDPDQSSKSKKEKVTTEFNGTVFKAMLKEPTKAMNGLETFISTAKKLPSTDLYDVVEGYIKISMECSEIFKLLEGERQTETEMMLIFQSLEMILLRTASDLSHFSMVGTAIVKKTISSFLKLIQGSLHSENHRFVRQCLSFLSAMVTQNADTAREVYSNLFFNKSLFGLARRKDKMGRPDVRMAYIQFSLSFLVSGDPATIGQLLEVKDFLPEILSSGLKEDRISIVNLILSTLQTRVVQNKAISKTQKVRFFTPTLLAHIASLYKWNGIVDASSENSQLAENADEAGKALVRELVHRFLLVLCCSRKHGISFHDPSLGTVGKAGNIVLLQFIVGLKQAMEDDMVAGLVVSVLKDSPDILPRYFKETQYSFVPRPKSAWQDNVKLLKKIYEAQPEVSKAFQTREMVPLPRLLAMVMVTSFPPVLNKAFFNQGIHSVNIVVLHTTLSMVSFVLRRAHRNMEHCLDKTVWQNSEIYTPAMMEDFIQQYREALSKILPDMTSIISKWQLLTKKDKGDGNEKQEEEEAEVSAPESAEVIMLKATILQVMCLYQKVVPHLVSQSKFDFSKLLKGIVSEKGIREEVPPVLQYQILQLALDLPASKFSWFRVQDAVDTEVATAEKSVFYLLLKMFVSSNSSHLKTSTRKLVLKVLKDSGVFEYTWAELELWLNTLARLEPAQQETVIQFLERVLVRLVCNPYIYTDKVASLVQEAAYLQANLSGQEGDAVSIPISHIDDVLDMVDVIMESNEGEMEEFGPSLSDDLILQTFPFSAVVPAVLEARNKLPAAYKTEKGVVYEYVASVLSDVLHCQRDPLPLCLALLQYDKELAASEDSSPHPSVLLLHGYYCRWLPQQSQEQPFKSCEIPGDSSPPPASFAALLKATYSRGVSALLEDGSRESLEQALSSMEMTEHPLAVKQTLLYVKSTVDNYGTEAPEATAELAGDTQGGSDYFMEIDPSSGSEENKDQVLLAVLSSIFKQPCVEQWFLAVELGTLPPHTLNPVRLKSLSGLLSDLTLALLQTAAASLKALGRLELLGVYLGSVETAVLRELEAGKPQATPQGEESRPLRALLALQGYMDSSPLNRLGSALLLLPRESLVGVGVGGRAAELSAYGRAALRVLPESTGRPAQERRLALSQAHLRGLGTLLLSCPSPALEAFLLRALAAQPGSAKLVHPDVLRHCLRAPRPPTRAIGSLLLENCSTHRLAFELWCLEEESVEQLAGRTEDYLPLVKTYLQVAGREDPARPKDVQTVVLKQLKQTLLSKLCASVLSEDGKAEDTLAQHVDTLASLIKMAAAVRDIRELIDELPTALQKAGGFDRWQLVDAVSAKLVDCPEEQESWRKAVLSAALKWLVSSMSQSTVQSTALAAQQEDVLKRLQELSISVEDIVVQEWNSFVKTGLKYRYRDPRYLGTLNSLLDLHGASEVPKDMLPLATMHMMATSHSLFLPTMLDPGDDSSEGLLAKEALVSLLLTLVKKCPSVCDINHFVVLLGAYGATLSMTDQKLMLLLRQYERNDVSLVDFQSLLWGPAAVEHHKARRSLGASLWQQPSTDDLLALLKADTMVHTIAHFPQHRRIIPQEGKELLCDMEGVNDLASLYDPCFLLPLFSVMLRSESVIDCLKFVSSHAFGVSVVALSSYDPKVRSASYQVLGSYYQHLEAARFREKKQLLYLLDTVKNGIRQKNLRLPFVLTTYIAKVAQQMLKPEDHMYVVVNRFLLSHQSLDFNRVPEFFKLFYSHDMENKVEREWILSVLEEGLTGRYCYELCDQQGIFQTLLCFSSSPLCDEQTQTQIVRVLHKAAHVNAAAYNLTKSHGLLTWTLQLVEKRHLDQRLLSAVIDLLHVLWFSNLGQKENPVTDTTTSSSSSDPTTEDKPKSVVKCLPLPLINEFLCVTSNLIRHLRVGVKSAQLNRFLQTLSSVLRHRGTALRVHADGGWLTVHPHAVSCAEALTLLQRWAALSHDTPLLAQLQGVAEKHKVKELLGTGKEKGRVRGSSSSSSSQGRVRAEEQGDDSDTDKPEQTSLSECKPHLRKIFTHWESGWVLSSVPSGQPPQPIDPQAPSGLVKATAHLLTKWSLRSLVDGPCDLNRLTDFLEWFHKVVASHRQIVEVVVADPALKVDLLGLYHRAFESPDWPADSRRAGALQLFTTVMLDLLKAQGGFSEGTHQTVLTACMSGATHDPTSEEAGRALLSLYIHEVWSGAESPPLFLLHARTVIGAKGKGLKKSKRSLTPSAARSICCDIVSAMESCL
ncbi:nucleolar pre-ribosomal-associated protein 1 [Aplochiton taeniatus]